MVLCHLIYHNSAREVSTSQYREVGKRVPVVFCMTAFPENLLTGSCIADLWHAIAGE